MASNDRLMLELYMAENKKFVDSQTFLRDRHLRAEEFAHLGHWQYFVADNILITSDEMNRIFGHNPETYRMSLDDGVNACHPDDLDRVNSAFDVAMKTGKTFDYTHRIVKTDGELRTIHAKTEFELREDGQILSMFGVIQDVTMLKHTEEKLRKSEQALTHHIQNTPLGYISWDKNFICTDWNKSAEIIFGFRAEEAIGRHAEELIVLAENRDEVDSIFKSLLAQTGGSHSTNKNISKDGIFLVCEWYNTPTIDADNVVTGVTSLILNITEKRAAENRAAVSEDALIRAEAVANSGHWSWNVETQKVDWSSQCFRIFGRDPKTWVPTGDNFREDMPQEDRDRLEKENSAGFESGKPFATVYRYYRSGLRDQEIWVEASCDFVRNESGEIVEMVGFVQDITDRKNLEEQLRQSQKMQAVGQLTGGIAHDFNNILGIVLGNLEIIQRLPPGDSRITSRIDVAKKNTERGADITRKLLGFSRKDVHVVKTTDINGSINNLIALVTKSLTVAIDVNTNLSDNLWAVEIDPGDFEDAILNLALNAHDAMAGSGTLTIATENKTLDEDFVERNPQSATGNFIMVSICDTGAGMTDNVKVRAFEPFFTTKDVGKGTGLGLSMVYGFVERSGGFILINSEIGNGTDFHLYIPRVISNEAGKDETEIGTDHLPRGHEKILIVDDEADLRYVAAFNLDELGYTTFTAEDGPSALKVLEQERDIDLLFSDVVMPNKIDGHELAQMAQELAPDLKILLASGHAGKRATIYMGDDEVFCELTRSLLGKPYSISEMANAIRKALDEEL